jgi:hypothetical protein
LCYCAEGAGQYCGMVQQRELCSICGLAQRKLNSICGLVQRELHTVLRRGICVLMCGEKGAVFVVSKTEVAVFGICVCQLCGGFVTMFVVT